MFFVIKDWDDSIWSRSVTRGEGLLVFGRDREGREGVIQCFAGGLEVWVLRCWFWCLGSWEIERMVWICLGWPVCVAVCCAWKLSHLLESQRWSLLLWFVTLMTPNGDATKNKTEGTVHCLLMKYNSRIFFSWEKYSELNSFFLIVKLLLDSLTTLLRLNSFSNDLRITLFILICALK
jgi:hypothetical protein